MEREEFLFLLDDLLDLDQGTLTGEEVLSELEAWDSLAAVGFIALADEQFGVAISPAHMRQCKTVADLLTMAGF